MREYCDYCCIFARSYVRGAQSFVSHMHACTLVMPGGCRNWDFKLLGLSLPSTLFFLGIIILPASLAK